MGIFGGYICGRGSINEVRRDFGYSDLDFSYR